MRTFLRPLFIATLLLATPTHAASIKAHFEAMNSTDATTKAVANTYLNGIVDSTMYMNAILRGNHKKPAFCLPDGVSLNRELLADIIEFTYRNAPKEKQDPTLNTGMIAIIGLTNTYPCTGGQQ
ncbi:hypothetical protein ACFL53_00505 [Pseudomonadota bacterium]